MITSSAVRSLLERASALVCVLSLVACGAATATATAEADPACLAPFANLPLSGASPQDQQVLREASEDFCAVLADNLPLHARLDPEAATGDGGSRHYIGRRYELTALESLSLFGSFRGTARGPVLRFDPDFAPGHTNEISNVRVYPLPSEGAEGNNR